MKNLAATLFCFSLLFAACDSSASGPAKGTYIYSLDGYTMEITILDDTKFELKENGEHQVKGTIKASSGKSGFFEISDVCLDNSLWFTFEEMKEITNWDQKIPFTFTKNVINFSMRDMPTIPLKPSE